MLQYVICFFACRFVWCKADTEHAKVRIDAYRCKLWQLANKCGGEDWSQVQEACVPALKRQFDHLMRKADFANCLILAKAYSTCGQGPEFSAPAIILATNERLPSHYRARAERLIAQKLSDLDCRDQQRQHYENARKAFEDMNHRHGALDIKIAQLCQDALNPDQCNVVENINELFDTYKSLDFPNGLSAAYLELLELAVDLRDGNLQAEILGQLSTISQASGSMLTYYIARCSTLSRLKLSASDDGKVISGATALWHDLAGSDCSLLRGLVAETVYRAYNALKHSEMSTIWAKRARVDLARTSEATLIPLVEGTELEELNDLRNSYADVFQPHNHDIAGVPLEKRIERLEEFAYQLISIRGLGSETPNLMAHALEMLENDIRLLEDPTLVCLKSAKYQEIKASWLFKKSPARQDVELEMEAINQFNMAKKTYLEQKRVDLAAFLLQRQALIYFGVFQKFERWKHPDEQHVLGTALNLYKVTLDSAVGLGLKFMIRENAYWVALCQYEQWKKGKCSSENVLGSLLSAEGHADQHRNELSILQGMETVVTKRQLSSEKHVRDIYRFAIQVCRSSGKWEDAWKWVQKSKARSLSDILGLGVLLPRAMVDEIEEQEVTSRLYVDECKLLERLSNASSSEKFQTRIQLDRHQDQIREHRCLQEVLNLREGASINLRELQDISKLGTNHEARPMKFVDWIITEHNILVSVISTTGQLTFNFLDITLQQIEAWVAEHMSGQGNIKASSETKTSLQGLKEDDDSDKGPLRDLDALIRPLSELSDPDDLIVLCPSGPLHSLPLHALRLLDQDGERVPLLMRNPIVYCASLTTFVQCCRRAAERGHTEPKVSSSFIAAYEPEAVNDDNVISGFDLDEREKLYSSNKVLATDFNAEGYCGEESTTAVLKACLERSHMVQFLGHCDIKGKNLIDQSLRLYSTSDGPGKQHLKVLSWGSTCMLTLHSIMHCTRSL